MRNQKVEHLAAGRGGAGRSSGLVSAAPMDILTCRHAAGYFQVTLFVVTSRAPSVLQWVWQEHLSTDSTLQMSLSDSGQNQWGLAPIHLSPVRSTAATYNLPVGGAKWHVYVGGAGFYWDWWLGWFGLRCFQ